MEFINITPKVEKALNESGVKEGLCLVNAMHITASVFINDDEKGLHEDYKKWLEENIPHNPELYKHNLTGEYNERRACCEEAVSVLQPQLDGITALRDLARI